MHRGRGGGLRQGAGRGLEFGKVEGVALLERVHGVERGGVRGRERAQLHDRAVRRREARRGLVPFADDVGRCRRERRRDRER